MYLLPPVHTLIKDVTVLALFIPQTFFHLFLIQSDTSASSLICKSIIGVAPRLDDTSVDVCRYLRKSVNSEQDSQIYYTTEHYLAAFCDLGVGRRDASALRNLPDRSQRPVTPL